MLGEKNFFGDYHESRLMVEKFVDGILYHIDGILYKNELVACWPSKYMAQPIKALLGNTAQGHILSKENPLTTSLIDYVKGIIGAMPACTNMAFHLEVFHVNDKDLVLCEIAARTGGGGIIECWEKSFGVNLVNEFTRIQAGLPPSDRILKFSYIPSCLSAWILFPTKEGILKKIGAECELPFVEGYKVTKNIGDRMQIPEALDEYLASISPVIADTEPEIISRVSKAIEWFYRNLVIEKVS